MTKQFKIITKETAYNGFFRLEKYWLQHTLYAGGWSETICRELFVRGSCVAVLLYDPQADQVILIEQFRIGAVAQPDRAWLLEIVAGAIEEGETAEQVAYREALEEAGCPILQLKKISEFFTTPGGVGEKITLFCGRVDSREVGGVHGLAEEGEDIRVESVDFDTAYRMIASGEIESAIPIIALQWLALNKTQLQQEWQ